MAARRCMSPSASATTPVAMTAAAGTLPAAAVELAVVLPHRISHGIRRRSSCCRRQRR